MTKTIIRAYQPADKPNLVRFMEELQDHLIELDPLKRFRRLSEYGAAYTDDLLTKIKSKGQLFVAQDSEKLVGVIALTVSQSNRLDGLGGSPKPSGEITELYVSSAVRSQGVGKQLIRQAEDYCRSQGCDALNVEVLAPNLRAHQFYTDCGYQDRSVCLLKIL